MRAAPVIAGSLAGFILLAVCIITVLLLQKRKHRLRKERALRMSEFLHDCPSNRSMAHETPPPSDPDKPRPSPTRLDSPLPHSHTPAPSPSPSPSPSPLPASSHRSIPLNHQAESEHTSNNRLRRGTTSISDVIFAHHVQRSDGDSAGALIPSIVVSEGGLPYVNHSRESFTRTITRAQEDARILPPPDHYSASTDTRPPSRRTNGSTSLSIPSLALQSAPPSSTLLYPTFDSSPSASSASFPSPLLSSPSSSPTIPSSSSFTAPSSKNFSSTPNNERIAFSAHESNVIPVSSALSTSPVAQAAFIGPSLRSGGEDEAPPAYEKCVCE